ncbi:MAG: hypothetical protein JRN57_01565 [Nitrososphaerota archaeon]|nr:hypothetical protein [Nitrososphaerota archaeon]MDG7010784.1 hypothetical protein [Nitrososphaerota archaeon]
MPKIAESVLVSYCDFCQELNERAKAHSRCKLCGSLLCGRHQITISFDCGAPEQRERTPAQDLFESLLMQVPTSFMACICPECADNSRLSEIARRVVDLRVKAVPNKGTP